MPQKRKQERKDRQPSRLEKNLMRALGLKDVRQLDALLQKAPDPRVELENQPPDEQLDQLERELEEEELSSSLSSRFGLSRPPT